MESTGITRKIDNLGRIVIPKEIRKNLKIKDSDDIEINVIDDKIILRKYELLKQDKKINDYLYIMGKYLKKNILFTSRDYIIDYYLLNNEKIKSLELDNKIINLINNRTEVSSESINISLFNKQNYIISPLIINGDLIGSIIVYGMSDLTNEDKSILHFSKKYLELYLE